MKCALCGYEYDETDMDCHTGCPMGDGCSIICCPNCGFQVVDESKSKSVALVRRVQETISHWWPLEVRN